MTDQLPDSELGRFQYGTHTEGPPETGADERSALAGGQAEQAASSPHRPISPGPSSETRFDERLGRLLGQKKGPDAVMLSVLSVALLLGLIGLAVHFIWIVAIIVMALGLGFTVANSRRDRIDVTNPACRPALRF